MKVDEIKNVLIVGSGTMGQQIGFQCALYDCNVVLYDIKKEMLEKAMERINRIASRMTREGRITQEKAAEAISRIKTTVDMAEAAKDADIVSESVPEDPELKGRVFGQLNALVSGADDIHDQHINASAFNVCPGHRKAGEISCLPLSRHTHDERGRCHAASRDCSGVRESGKRICREDRSGPDRAP